MMRFYAALCFALCAVAVPLNAVAQTPQPATSPSPSPPSSSPSPSASAGPADPCTSLLALVNRPTVTTGSCVFKTGHGDVELGYTNTVTIGTGGGVAAAYPQAFLRVGTDIRNLELDLTPPSYQRQSLGDTVIGGATDSALGLKWEIAYTSKAVFSTNVIGTLPSGNRAFTAGGSSYTVNLNAGYALTSALSAAATLGFQSLAAPQAGGGVARTGVFLPSLLFTASLPGNAQAFTEIAYQSHAGVGLPGRTLYDVGLQKQFGQRVVIDVETGFAPAPVAGQSTQYVGFGFTYGL